MKIIILGAGRVGSTVAESLVSEANDITVIDTNQTLLASLQNRLDLRVVHGNAAHPTTLASAGANDADMVIAVTQSDQTNLVACKIAATLFNTPTRIARIHSIDYLSHPELFSQQAFCVDFAICPEQILTDYIVKLIEFPESLQVLSFAQGKVSLVATRVFHGGPLVGHELHYLRTLIPNIDTRVAAIFRHDRSIVPEGNTIIEAGDEVFFIAAAEHIRSVMRELGHMDKPVKKVMIAGGGYIGSWLARSLEYNYQVKLIEFDKKKCGQLASELNATLILHGDVTDETLLESENCGEMDVFCAITNDDENNIMSSLLAKRLGVKRAITIINRTAYVDLMQAGAIDIALSPSHATIGSLLAHVRRGDVVAVHSLRRGAAEALEIVAHGDARTSKVVGKRIDEISLPNGTTIGAVVRQHSRAKDKKHAQSDKNFNVLMAHHDTIIETDDHVIIFVNNKRMIPQVEKLFQVGIGFL